MRTFDQEVLVRLKSMLASRPADEIDAPDLRRACVLLPLLDLDGEWALLFSHRSPNLALHSGQVAFPGGSVENGEALPTAALRETEEEVGIPLSEVDLIGRLDDLITRTGFVVAPFVGVVRRRVEYVLQESEVTSVYEVPLRSLLDRRNPDIRYVRYQGQMVPSYVYHHESVEIWGLTARILKGFLDLVRTVW